MEHIRFILLFGLLTLGGCATAPDEPAYRPSNTVLPTGQTSFDEYVNDTRRWLIENRLFMTKNAAAEVDANSPYELLPPVTGEKTRGILLVHGLSDSPFSFVDIAPQLQQMGFHVRTLLLEGHGSRPADLLNADFNHWQALVEHHVRLFKPEVDELYLGGFSTGANLVTAYALSDPDIAGLALWSPGFRPKTQVARLAPVVSLFSDWLYTPSMKSESNYVRYLVAPSNSFAQYYHSSADVMLRLNKDSYDKPVFMGISQDDSVVDAERILSLFSSHFTHPASRLIWYGEPPKSDDNRVSHYSGYVPEFKVSNFSHMGLLFSPQNPYYGPEGSQRICENGQNNPEYWQCLKNGEIWYSAWGLQLPGKAHARLTFNPWFGQMIDTLKGVLNNPR